MTKRILAIFIATLVLTVFSVQASSMKNSYVPEAVLKSIKTEHPDAKKIKVDKELHFGIVLYKVKYKSKGIKYKALFNSQGQYFGHEERISISQLPKLVIKTLQQSFKQLKIEKAKKIEHPDGRIEYKIDVEDGKKEWELVMNPNGDILLKKRD